MKTHIESKDEKDLVAITNGKTPVTDYEKKLAKDIKEIKAKGRVVEIPTDI